MKLTNSIRYQPLLLYIVSAASLSLTQPFDSNFSEPSLLHLFCHHSSNSNSQNKNHSYRNDKNSFLAESSDPSFNSIVPQPTIVATQGSRTLNPSISEITDGKVFLDYHMHPQEYVLPIACKCYFYANFPFELRT